MASTTHAWEKAFLPTGTGSPPLRAIAHTPTPMPQSEQASLPQGVGKDGAPTCLQGKRVKKRVGHPYDIGE